MSNNEISYLTEAMAIWLFGAVAAWGLILSGAVLKLFMAQWQMRMAIAQMKVAVDLFIDTLGEKLAKVLHADDDHHQLDELLDKYMNPAYELSYEEWFELKNRCNHILETKTYSDLERSLAGLLAAVCEHKLISKFGKTAANV
jgi:hypothetical protein